MKFLYVCGLFLIFIKSVSTKILFDAVVISNNQTRYEHTRDVLQRVGFRVSQFTPLDYKSDTIDNTISDVIDNGFMNYNTRHGKAIPLVLNDKTRRKIYSNKLSVERLIASFREHDNRPNMRPAEWKFIFEDDIQINSTVIDPYTAITTGMRLARHSGLLYLGLCIPGGSKYDPERTTTIKSVNYTYTVGFCAHAFGITRWKIESFLNILNFEKKHIEAMDYTLVWYTRFIERILLVGSNFISAQNQEHAGLFYQDRNKFPSIVQQKES